LEGRDSKTANRSPREDTQEAFHFKGERRKGEMEKETLSEKFTSKRSGKGRKGGGGAKEGALKNPLLLRKRKVEGEGELGMRLPGKYA